KWLWSLQSFRGLPNLAVGDGLQRRLGYKNLRSIPNGLTNAGQTVHGRKSWFPTDDDTGRSQFHIDGFERATLGATNSRHLLFQSHSLIAVMWTGISSGPTRSRSALSRLGRRAYGFCGNFRIVQQAAAYER